MSFQTFNEAFITSKCPVKTQVLRAIFAKGNVIVRILNEIKNGLEEIMCLNAKKRFVAYV